MDILKTIAAVALCGALAGCGTLSGPCETTVWYQDTDGAVKTRCLEMPDHRPEFLSTGIMSEGYMPAPTGGK